MTKVWHIGGEDVHMRIPLLKRLAGEGFEVGAVGTGCASHFEAAEIEYHEIELKRGLGFLSDAQVVLKLITLFNRHRPDIVHGFDTKPSFLTPIATFFSPSTVAVRTINGMGSLYSEESLKNRILRPLYCCAQLIAKAGSAHVVFQNTDDYKYFIRHSLTTDSKSSLIRGSGVDAGANGNEIKQDLIDDLREELDLDPNVPVVALVARLVRDKGIYEFLDAARMLDEANVQASFLLVGPLESEGSQAVDKDILDYYSDVVKITGPRNDVPVVLAATDLFVLPSYYREGVPRALLEAAVSGLPLVATDMPGCRDVVSDGYNGLLVEPRNAEALASALIKILSELPAWKLRASQNRNAVIEQFGINRVAAEHAELYSKLTVQPVLNERKQ